MGNGRFLLINPVDFAFHALLLEIWKIVRPFCNATSPVSLMAMKQVNTPQAQSKMAEAALIRCAQQGDADAFGDLYELHLTSIYRYVYYRVGNKHEAEDLTETVFLKAWEALPKYHIQKTPLLAWLYRIARNIIIDEQRKKRMTMVDIDTQIWLSSDDAMQPEVKATLHSQMDQVAAAIAELPKEQQDVLILRFVNGLSHGETAEILGRSSGSVRVIQHRALNALRRWLKERVA